MTYTFRCRKCGRLTIVEHGLGEPHPRVCLKLDPDGKAACGGELGRVYDPPAVLYRVSGFYTMDSKLTPVKPVDYHPDEDGLE